jgi:hypothetical protein
MGNDASIPASGNESLSSLEGGHRPDLNELSSSSPEVDLGPDLNKLCQKKDWQSVIPLAHLSPSIYEKTIAAANTPLHTAISNYAPLEVVQALVFAYPPSVSYQNRYVY